MISRVQMKGPEGLRLGIPAGQVLGLRWEQNALRQGLYVLFGKWCS